MKSDTLIDREELRSSSRWWRGCTFVVISLSIFFFGISSGVINLEHSASPTIARVYIHGTISDDIERNKVLDKLAKNPSIKAVIVHIDSPGGTVVGSEVLYNKFKQLSSKKYVIAVLGTVAASGGYMAALASDYIIAHHGTITGSIGVLLNHFQVTELGKKVGIEVETIKAGEFKSALSPFEKMSVKPKQLVQEIVNDSYDFFVSLVAQNRNLSVEDAKNRAGGKIYTGRQALKANLIDQIGDEDDAITWLNSKKITGNIKTIELNKKSDKNLLDIFNIRKHLGIALMAM